MTPRNYIWHAGEDADTFIQQYFAKSESKSILFVGAIGFDLRALETYNRLTSNGVASIYPVFIIEERNLDSNVLKERAKQRRDSISTKLGLEPEIHTISIFAEDGAAVGGRRVIEMAETFDIEQYTDIVIDISAMSRGIFFPLTRYLREKIKPAIKPLSLHILVIDEPAVDYSYVPHYDDRASYMHGYDGGVQRVGANKRVKLWLPQLMKNRPGAYDLIHSMVSPEDVCPVLPFPGINAKLVDELVAEYHEQIINTWNTELQNIVLAAESDPLDLYHTVVRVDSARKKIFNEALTILSPMGSKVSTIGGMLAAMDLNLPVTYVETVGYGLECKEHQPAHSHNKMVHVWVDGPIYDRNDSNINQ